MIAWHKLTPTGAVLGAMVLVGLAAQLAHGQYGGDPRRSRLQYQGQATRAQGEAEAKPKVASASSALSEAEPDPAPEVVRNAKPLNPNGPREHMHGPREPISGPREPMYGPREPLYTPRDPMHYPRTSQRAAYQRMPNYQGGPNQGNSGRSVPPQLMARRNMRMQDINPMPMDSGSGGPAGGPTNHNVMPPGMPVGQQPMRGEEVHGEMMYDDGGWVDDGGPGCGGCGHCDDCCGGCCGDWLTDNLYFFGGVQGFKGPVDLGVGNFGFDYGVNWAIPLVDCWGLGYQLGGQIVHSNLEGQVATESHRTQYFVTTGIFQRQMNQFGWQWGLAVDFLHDDFIVTSDLVQLRTELSYVLNGCHDFGFWGAFGVSKSVSQTGLLNNQELVDTLEQQPTDLFAFFYRKRFCNGGYARFSGGFTGDGDGLLAADAATPLTNSCMLQVAATYLPPQGSEFDSIDEAWGITLNLVWYPGCKGLAGNACNPYRPLFNVADNTTFIPKQRFRNQAN